MKKTEEAIEITRENSGIIKDVLANGCYHCKSESLKHIPTCGMNSAGWNVSNQRSDE